MAMATSKRKVLRIIRPNAGLTAKYRRQMQALIEEMARSVEYWLVAAYRNAPPRLAQDAMPFREIRKKLRELSKRWMLRFDEAAPLIAETYVKGQFKATDSAMMMALRDMGWAIKFEMTPAVREAFEASLAENIGLIKSIPERYLQQVEGIVSRSYASGRDLNTMITELRRLYPITSRRAVLIARDQSNKANAVVNKARQLEIGITEAVWKHSHSYKTARPDHLKADGRVYKIAEGCLISGRYIYPGQEINCGCLSKSVLPF